MSCEVASWSSSHLQCKWPVRSSQSSNQVGASGGEHVVNGVGRGDDALASRLGGIPGEPAHDVSGLLIVESLQI